MDYSRQEIEDLIGTIDLKRNLRGQVRLALSVLPSHVQRNLACDFTEHAYAQTLKSDLQPPFGEAVASIRGFLLGRVEIEQVNRICNDARRKDRIEKPAPLGASIEDGPFASLLRTHLLACCLPELKQAGLILWQTRYRPDAMAVAEEARKLVQQYSRNNDPGGNLSLKKASARRTHDAELRWQRNHILGILDR